MTPVSAFPSARQTQTGKGYFSNWNELCRISFRIPKRYVNPSG